MKLKCIQFSGLVVFSLLFLTVRPLYAQTIDETLLSEGALLSDAQRPVATETPTEAPIEVIEQSEDITQIASVISAEEEDPTEEQGEIQEEAASENVISSETEEPAGDPVTTGEAIGTEETADIGEVLLPEGALLSDTQGPTATEMLAEEMAQAETELSIEEEPREQAALPKGVVQPEEDAALHTQAQSTSTKTASSQTVSATTTISKNFTGVRKSPEDGTWYYYKAGKINRSYTGIAKDPNTGNWYRIEKGKVNWNYTGVAKRPENGNWYFIKKGKLDWNYTGIAKNPANRQWFRVEGGKLNWNYTGIAKRPENGNWYRIEKGKLNWNYTGVAKRPENGNWYFIKKGKLDWNYTGVAKNPANRQWFRVEEGRLNWKYTGLAKRPENKNWYYIRKGKLDWTYTGMAKSPANQLYYHVRKGQVDFQATGGKGLSVQKLGKLVTWIGDSYSTWVENNNQDAKKDILAALPGVAIYAKGGKSYVRDADGNPSGLSILLDIRNQGALRDCLVFALGTNDQGLTLTQARKVVSQANKDTKIVLVTPYNKEARDGSWDFSGTIRALRTVARENENVYLADWASHCSDRIDRYFARDSIHPTSGGGYHDWVELIVNTIATIP